MNDYMQKMYDAQQTISDLNAKLTPVKTLPIPIDSITLRDFFAASAMQGLIARETRLNPNLSMYAGAAYNISDAMIEARKK
jgi:hypothetical protein